MAPTKSGKRKGKIAKERTKERVEIASVVGETGRWGAALGEVVSVGGCRKHLQRGGLGARKKNAGKREEEVRNTGTGSLEAT